MSPPPPPRNGTMVSLLSGPKPKTLAVGLYSTFCNNIGGAHNQTEVLPAVKQSLDPDLVIPQECWDLDGAASFVPPCHHFLRGYPYGCGAGLCIAVRRSQLSPDCRDCLVHDGRRWVAELLHIFPRGRLLIVNMHICLHLRYAEWVQEMFTVDVHVG